MPINVPAGDRHTHRRHHAGRRRRIQHIQLIGPDGRPVAGAKGADRSLQVADPLPTSPLSNSELTFIHANPGKAETIVIFQADRSLGASVDLKGDEPDPVRVTSSSRPARSPRRLVDEAGHPPAERRPGPHAAFPLARRLDLRRGGSTRSRPARMPAGSGSRTWSRDCPIPSRSSRRTSGIYSLRAEGNLKKE